MMVTERRVNPDCVNASNPFHVCAEYCVERAEVSKPRSPGSRLVGKGCRREEGPRIVASRRNVDPSCPNASNPFHQCAEYCSPRNSVVKRQNEKKSVQNVMEAKNGRKMDEEYEHNEGGRLVFKPQNGVKGKGVQTITVAARRVDPSCRNATNPFHECSEYCSPRKAAVKRQNEKRSVESVLKLECNRMVDPTCVNAPNPYHVCAEYCFQSKEMEHEEGSKSAKNVVRQKDPLCSNAYNPYHHCSEYCSHRKDEVKKEDEKGSVAAAENMERQKEDLDIVNAETKTDPSSSNAFNQYHQCAENYSPEILEAAREGKDKRSVKNGADIEGNRMMDPRCINASNPFHVCAEYCLQRKEMEHAEGSNSVSTHKERRGGFKMVEREDVLPNCVNASNPYHKCAEYCFQKVNQLA